MALIDVPSSAARILASRSREESSFKVIFVFIAHIYVQHDYTCSPGRLQRVLRNEEPSFGRNSYTRSLYSGGKLLRDPAIQINRLVQLLLLDVLAFGMRDVNRPWTDQQGLSPF